MTLDLQDKNVSYLIMNSQWEMYAPVTNKTYCTICIRYLKVHFNYQT